MNNEATDQYQGGGRCPETEKLCELGLEEAMNIQDSKIDRINHISNHLLSCVSCQREWDRLFSGRLPRYKELRAKEDGGKESDVERIERILLSFSESQVAGLIAKKATVGISEGDELVEVGAAEADFGTTYSQRELFGSDRPSADFKDTPMRDDLEKLMEDAWKRLLRNPPEPPSVK
jgi:hypothetical protein